MAKPKAPNVEPEGYEPPTSAEELLERYAAGERYFAGADLSSAKFELCRAKFETGPHDYLDLREVNLHHANLDRVDLRRSTLVKSDLRSASFVGANLHRVDLRGVDLGRAQLIATDLRGASLFETELSHALLAAAKLQDADLQHARALFASFEGAHLQRADLRFAQLAGAELRGADLRDADLRRADLELVDFRGTNLSGANFWQAEVERAVLDGVDLSTAIGLAEILHGSSSTVGTDSMRLTAAGLSDNPDNQGPIETFFRGCGLTEADIAYFRTLIGRPIEWFSAFISHSHEDKPFARRLYDALQGRGIRCWLDEHDMKPGDRMLNVVDQAIRLHDKLLLLCSEASLTSWWVQDEITKALEKERRDGRDIIIPLLLDRYLLDEWDHGLASQVRSRLAADFTDRSDEAFEREFEKVVRALRAETGE